MKMYKLATVALFLFLSLLLSPLASLSSYSSFLSIEELKDFFLNHERKKYKSSSPSSSFRYAVCRLTRAYGTITLNWKWLSELKFYNISAYNIQDNNYTHISHHRNITTLSISNQIASTYGYTNGGNNYHYNRVIENNTEIFGKSTIPNAWDKALFYFTMIDPHYEFVWFIEDDVYISSIYSFLYIHNNSIKKKSDVTIKEANSMAINDRRKHHPHGHSVWGRLSDEPTPSINDSRKQLLHTNQPWYYSIVVAVGISKNILSFIQEYIHIYHTLEYVEFLFPTIAVHYNYTLYCPKQFQTLTFTKTSCYDSFLGSYDGDDDNDNDDYIVDNSDNDEDVDDERGGSSWYHPVKAYDCWFADRNIDYNHYRYHNNYNINNYQYQQLLSNSINRYFNVSFILSSGLINLQKQQEQRQQQQQNATNIINYSTDIELLRNFTFSGNLSDVKNINFPSSTVLLDITKDSINIHLLRNFKKAKYTKLHSSSSSSDMIIYSNNSNSNDSNNHNNVPSTWLPVDQSSLIELRSDWFTSFIIEFKVISSWIKIGFIVYNHNLHRSSFTTTSSTNHSIINSTITNITYNNTTDYATIYVKNFSSNVHSRKSEDRNRNKKINLSHTYLEIISRSIRGESSALRRREGVNAVILLRYGHLPIKLYNYFYSTISKDIDAMIILEEEQQVLFEDEYHHDNNNYSKKYSNSSCFVDNDDDIVIKTNRYCHNRHRNMNFSYKKYFYTDDNGNDNNDGNTAAKNNDDNSIPDMMMLVSHTVFNGIVDKLDMVDISVDDVDKEIHLMRDKITIVNNKITRNCTQ